jgi:outer membrane lipoprotein SlyB
MKGHRMETRTTRISPVLIGTACVALILFCAASVAAFMGWLPSSNARDSVMSDAPATRTSKPAVAQARPAEQRSAPMQRAANAPPKASCAECGVVESVREIDTKGEGSGLGAVGGAVAGGLLGSQVGGGRGQDVMTVIGAVGGALAGNEVEKRVKSARSYSITVRLDDGSSRVISEADAPTWRTGDKVKVINGVIQSNA